MQAQVDHAFSAFHTAILEHAPDARQASSVANALLIAVLQSLACSSFPAADLSIGQQIQNAVNQADLAAQGHVQVRLLNACPSASEATNGKCTWAGRRVHLSLSLDRRVRFLCNPCDPWSRVAQHHHDSLLLLCRTAALYLQHAFAHCSPFLTRACHCFQL